MKALIWAFLLMMAASPLMAGAETNAINITAFGATADDTSDDTNSLRLALQSDAREIHVPKGTYILRRIRPYIPIRSEKTIICHPGAIFQVPGDAQVESQKTRHGYIFQPIFGASIDDPPINDFSMRGCKFIIEKQGTTPILIDKENSNRISIDGVVVDGKGQTSHNQAAYGILVNNGTSLTIRNTKISYTRGPAIVTRLPRKCTMENNQINHAGVDVAYTANGPEKGKYGVDYWNSAGISAAGASSCSITNNTVNWTGGAGIILRGGSNNCENNRVAFNRLNNIGKGGIGIGINTDGRGSSLNNVIEGNVISGYMQRWSDAGINVNHRGQSGEIRGITIANNVIDLYGNERTRYRFPTHEEFIKTYGGQIIIDPSGTGYADHIIIRGNILKNSIGPAITAKRLRNSEIKNNTICNSSRGLSEGGRLSRLIPARYPIVITEALNLKVNNNKIFSKIKPAIKISAAESEVSNNLVIDCGKVTSGKNNAEFFAIDLQDGVMKNKVFGNDVRKQMIGELCP